MEAKDLMIGDLVRVNRNVCIKNDTIVRVCGIDATNRLVERGLDGSATCVPVDDIDLYYGGIWVKYLSPIPLTPEILEKNGFRSYGDSWYIPCDDENVRIGFHMYETVLDIKTDNVSLYKKLPYGYRSTVKDETLSVHELQHALRLCGIDKEIVV